MALLERHGIGSGKYKVGGEITDNVTELVRDKGIFGVEMEIIFSDSTLIPLCVEVDSNGNIYGGGRGGVNSLLAYDSQGNLLWEVAHNSRVDFIKFDTFENCLWVLEDAVRVSKIDLDGNLILNIPYNKQNFRSLEVNETQLVLANYEGNSPNGNIRIYDKSGNNTTNLSKEFLHDLKIFKGNFLVVSNDRFQLLNQSNIIIWDSSTTISTLQNNTYRTYIQLGYNDLIYVYVANVSGNVFTNFYCFDENGILIGRKTRAQASGNYTIDTSNENIGDLSHYAYPIFISNQKSSPVIVNSYSTSVEFRTIDSLGQINFKRRQNYNVSMNVGIKNNWACLDANRMCYFIASGAKRIVKVDANIYHKIEV